MPAIKLNANLIERRPGLLGRGFTDRVNLLIKSEKAARRQAAATATAATQDGFTYKRAHDASRRPGRTFSTGGQFPTFLKWVATETGVGFDAKGANRRVPHWIIQEIGTGESARVRHGGESVNRGRPTKEQAAVSSPKIPSQRGRVIPSSLAFGTREGGDYAAPGSAHGQQLYLRQRLSGGMRPMQKHGHELVISKEIQGQHFVQKGGQEGFRQYRTSVLAAARQAFAGQRYRP